MNINQGLRLRAERERLGLTQEDLARKLGIHRNSQVRYENGLRDLTGRYLEACSEVGIDVNRVVTGFIRHTGGSRVTLICVVSDGAPDVRSEVLFSGETSALWAQTYELGQTGLNARVQGFLSRVLCGRE
jgi:transcriptional regulator with XRE-family HTH domain